MQQHITRRRAIAVLSFAPMGLLAACGMGQSPAPSESPPGAAAPSAGQPAKTAPSAVPVEKYTSSSGARAKELNWWITSPGLMETLADEYGKANDLAIIVQPQGNYDEMVKKVQAGIAANIVPDLAILGQRHGIPQIADSGKLIPLWDLVQADPSFGADDFLPAFWQKFTYKGKVQTTPFINSSPVLHYNRTLLKAAGLNPDEPPENWEQLVDAARELTVREGSDVVQWGLNTESDTPWYAYALIWQNGGALLSGSDEPTFNQAMGVGAIQFWRDWVHNQRVMPPLQHQNAKTDFIAGKVAMLFSSSASTGGLERDIGDRFEYGVARFPGNKVRAVPVGGASLGIFRSDASHETTAWNFVKWLTSPETNARISRETGYVAIREATLDLPEMKEYLAENPRRALAIQQVRDDIRAESVNPADAVIWLGLEKVQQQLESDGNVRPQQLLDDLASEVTKYLSEY